MKIRTLLALLLAAVAFGADRQVAITIDDLPRGGDGGPGSLDAILTMTDRLLGPFREGKVPVMGFANESRGALGANGVRKVLDRWLDAGADLGNHSYSHLNINNVPLERYTADIVRGEPVLRAALEARGKKLTYYRHPFLFTGPTAGIKQGLQTFLDQRGYRVAPVTFDDADYMFAALYMRPQFREMVKREYISYMESVVAFFEERSKEVMGREFPQILLIHANQLNADLMPDLLAMFRRRGYTFVTLDQALKDAAYRSPEEYVGTGGFSWIHRWSKTKGMTAKGEPEPAAWVLKAYEALPR